jgi:hypothetical protein
MAAFAAGHRSVLHIMVFVQTMAVGRPYCHGCLLRAEKIAPAQLKVFADYRAVDYISMLRAVSVRGYLLDRDMHAFMEYDLIVDHNLARNCAVFARVDFQQSLHSVLPLPQQSSRMTRKT